MAINTLTPLLPVCKTSQEDCGSNYTNKRIRGWSECDDLDRLGVDVVEQILVRLDVEDVLRCKVVCKSWHSLISTPRFVTCHLKHALKSDGENHQLGHRMFVCDLNAIEDECYNFNVIHIVGSYNGLVCFSLGDVKLLICNPSTREKKKLLKPPHRPHWRDGVYWGFGYADDDYKVVVGYKKNKNWTFFYMLTLKSNSWEFIGKVKYMYVDGKSGTLCGGALHWFMYDKQKDVIISVDLSTHKIKEIPQPGAEYGYVYTSCVDVKLGVIEECLSIRCSSNNKKWVMKNNKWELYTTDHDHCRSKYDVVHCWINTGTSPYFGRICGTDASGTRLPSDGGYARASIFVKVLVSPRLHEKDRKGQEDTKKHTKGDITKKKHKPLRLGN